MAEADESAGSSERKVRSSISCCSVLNEWGARRGRWKDVDEMQRCRAGCGKRPRAEGKLSLLRRRRGAQAVGTGSEGLCCIVTDGDDASVLVPQPQRRLLGALFDTAPIACALVL